MNGYKKLLVATDLDEAAAPVMQRARSLARSYGAELVLLYVLEHLPHDVPADVVPPEGRDETEYLIEETDKRLAAVAARHGLEGCPRRVATGGLKHALFEAAEEERADLIVIGTHGRQGIQRLLGRSPANAALHGAPCDVLVVKIGA